MKKKLTAKSVLDRALLKEGLRPGDDIAAEQMMGARDARTPAVTIQWTAAAIQLPDADLTVLIHCPISDDPVWLGYFDGETWRDVDGGDLGTTFVDHWANLPDPPVVNTKRRRSAT